MTLVETKNRRYLKKKLLLPESGHPSLITFFLQSVLQSVLLSVLLLILCACGSGNSVSPVREEDRKAAGTCTISIECAAIWEQEEQLNPAKREFVPEDGIILPECQVPFGEEDTIFDLLRDTCQANGIQMESSYTPLYKSYYIKGIHQIYEFDCGATSGWMFSVNGKYPNYGCSQIKPEDGDVICWRYTCNLGSDIGGDFHEN